MQVVAICEGTSYPADLSPWILFAMAVFILMIVTRSKVVSREEGAMEVRPCAAVIWIVMASVGLCLLFYFMEYLQVLLRVLICFIGTLALAFVIETACCERLVESVGQQRRFNW